MAQKVFSSSPTGRQDQNDNDAELDDNDAELEEDADLKDDVDDLEDDPEFNKKTERGGERANSACGAAGNA